MKNLNYTVFTGNLTADAEAKKTSSGSSFLVLSVAVNRSFKDGEQWQTITTYINHIAWFTKFANESVKNFKKGTKVTIQGHLVNNNFVKDGKKYSLLEVRVDDIEIVKFPADSHKNSETESANKSTEAENLSDKYESALEESEKLSEEGINSGVQGGEQNFSEEPVNWEIF